jgi:ribosomal protein S18 acetylase RimI-like enzyme
LAEPSQDAGPDPIGGTTSGGPRASLSKDEIRHLERLLRRGWPPLETVDLDGWILGASGGYTRRASSVVPERFTAPELGAAIARVEAWYAARGRPCTFKLTAASEPAGLDAALAARGYARDGETLVMEAGIDAALASAARPSRGSDPDARGHERVGELIAGRVDPGWLAASCAISEVPSDRQPDYHAILERIVDTAEVALFGDRRVAGRIASVALGSVVEGAVLLAQIATQQGSRGQGLAEQTIRSILYAARERGAERALLSVEVGNAPARRLYERLGFTVRYRYAYRQRAV